MKKLFPIILLAGFLVMVFCQKPAPPIQGVWKMVHQEWSNADTLSVTPPSWFRSPQIKIVTKSHFAFGCQTSKGKLNAGGGTYTLKGNEYVEKIVYHTDTTALGKSVAFMITFKHDTLYQEGNFLGYRLLEKYVRME